MSAPDNHLYEFGSFMLDAGSRILLKDRAVVRLTPKAFDTLLVLVQRGPQLVEKDQLLKEVWPDSFVEEGSLSRNIHELRKGLGDDSSEPRYIETIPKRGYRFVAPVKVLARSTAQTNLGLHPNATAVEEYTTARALDEEAQETKPPGEAMLRVTEPKTAQIAIGTPRRQKQGRRAAFILVALLLAGTIVAFIYLKPARQPAGPRSQARNTFVRLTNNNANDLLPIWSPDGSKIVFCSNRDGKNEIYVMDADGSNVKRLTNNLANDAIPRWSPDGNKIVFDSDRDGNQEIYVMDADGGNQIRLTKNGAIDSGASWSPDGGKIAFASNRDNDYPYNFDIYVMNADGGDLKRLVEDPEYDAEPRWSPDGSAILFVTGRTGNFDVYTMAPDGSNQKNLTADSFAADGAPAWSPDGSNIAFATNRDGNGEVYIMDADGGYPMRVSNNSADDGRPSWSPDGSKLVFQTERDGNSEICVMSADGELDQLTDDSAEDVNPAWSPNGGRIALSSNRAGKQHIYVMNADGSSLTQITSSLGDDFEPAWSPDGKRIAFTSSRDGNREIYLMNADGSNQIRLTVNAAIDTYPKWSPDGRILFNSTRDGQGDIYVMDDNGGNVRRLTTLSAGQPDWSRDGTKIAFMGHPRSESIPQIYVADSDGNNVVKLATSTNPASEPCWSPVRGQIVFAKVIDKLGARVNVFQMETDGRNFKRLTAGPARDQRPSLSPDGSKLAFQSNRDGDYEIYVRSLR